MTELSEKSFIGLVALLAECKRRGYKELWLNCPNPHWTNSSCEGMIVAAPKRRHGSWPAVWDLHYVPQVRELLGRQSCGNGLKNADQAQYHDMDKNIPPSHYVLVENDWLLEGELI
jgi:hypothetical protein